MKDLSLEDFSGSVGQSYDLVAGDHLFPLTLEAAEPLAHSIREAGGFRLTWRGPQAPVLPQAIYTFRREGEELEMFIVPVGQDSTGTEYEAVFN